MTQDTPSQVPLARIRGIAALRAGDMVAARQLLSAAVAQDPNDPDAWLWLSGAVSDDGERRYCLLRVQQLNPTHPAAIRGLATLPSVEPVDPLASAAPTPLTLSRTTAPAEARALPVTPLARSEPAPIVSAAPPRYPSWQFWAAVGGLSLVLTTLLGILALRIATRPTPTQPAVLVATGPTPAPTRTPPTATLTIAAPSPTAPPPATETSQPSSTPAPPTAAPTIPVVAATPAEGSAPALAARGLTRQRRDDDLSGAMADYTAAITRDPHYADAYYLRAALRYDLGDAQGAEDDYTRALQIDSTSAVARYLSGRVEMSRGDRAAALAAYNEALRIDPAYAPAYYSRAVAKTEQNDIAGAIADYTAAIAADPTFAFAYSNRANLYDELGLMDAALMDAALRDYATAIRLDPRLYYAYFNRGYAYRWYLHQPTLALADFRMAVTLRPTSAEAYCELGNVRHALGDAQGGLADTTQAITIDPEYACAYYTRGRINVTLQRYPEAIADLTRYIALAPPGGRIADAYIERGVAYANSGKVETAVEDYTHAIALNPQEPVAYNNRGNCYISLGDLKAAQADLTIAAELYRQQGQMDDYNRVTQKLRELAQRVS